MARRKVDCASGQYYHIYNRGANRGLIFHVDDNYLFLLRRLNEHSTKLGISVIAYCLMPNHFHFLLRQDGEFPISHLMQAVFNSYTKAFNKAFGRTGTLFEGPFEATHVDRNDYLVHLCRYIHRNPLDAGLVSNPSQWPFSNYLEWIGKRNGSLVDQAFVHDFFPDPRSYEIFVMEYTPSQEINSAIKRFSFD